MSHGKSDESVIATTHNTARFFVEHRQVAWVLLVATVCWGVFAYFWMPKRKDPVFPARTAVAICAWPGVAAETIEALVTRRIEQKIAENSTVTKLESIVRTSVTVISFDIDERISDTSAEFDDIKLRLDGLTDLPTGTQPIIFLKDFAETAALLLTVASPPVSGPELDLKARDVQRTISGLRAGAPDGERGRSTVVVSYPLALATAVVERPGRLLAQFFEEQNIGRGVRVGMGSGFIAIDGAFQVDDDAVLRSAQRFINERLHQSEFHPDVWPPVVVRDPATARDRLATVAGDKYTYRDLDRFTDLIQKSIQTIPAAAKVERAGVLKQRVYLDYSQQRLAAYGLQPSALPMLFAARNTQFPGGVLELGAKNITIDPSGELTSEREIGDILAPRVPGVLPVHLRDVVDISRDYESPARFLNYYTSKDASGHWRRARAITVGIQMRQGQQIREFGKAVDDVLADVRSRLPPDLIFARTSDQALQVSENLEVFTKSLYEAVILVVVVALVGFWEWRSALLLALSIPVTLAMTAGFMAAIGVDLQQISIGALIVSLGLLVDDPVVANDAIKRELAGGHPHAIAAWLGPTKLGRAILFATITNIAAYAPLLLLSGDLGRFIWSIPVVLACSLVASRIVSMTFVPLLAYYLLGSEAGSQPALRRQGAAGRYANAVRWALGHRGLALGASVAVIAIGFVASSRIKTDFFPKDLSYLSYLDVWLPADAPLSATNQVAAQAERIVQKVADDYGAAHPAPDGKPRDILASTSSFVGGGSPRFWFSVAPEAPQLNYAQVLIQVRDKHDTASLLPLFQRELSASVAGARIDVRQLELGKPVGIPVAIRISGTDIPVLRDLAEQAKAIFRAIPTAMAVRDDWGEDTFAVRLKVDQERANDAGVSNLDVAVASASTMNGAPLTTLREGDEEIPVVLRLRMEDRAQISDVQSLFVTSVSGPGRAMLRQVSNVEYATETEKIRRRDQFRTVTVATAPVPGTLPSEVMNLARPALARFASTLPPGYKMVIGGSEEEQNKGFGEMSIVMAASVALIFLAMVIQFNHAFKPLIVFATIPFGVVGALVALAITGRPFGFNAFMGVASLIGVIVSHVIVLFDFIEEMHDRGEPLEDALIDAGIVRLRPVLVTVAATVFALIPLTMHGGPFWEALCLAQIGGLTFATAGTLWLVPLLYAVAVLDLKAVSWNEPAA